MPLISNVFEKVRFDQPCNYMSKSLKSLLCGFRKPHTLFRLLQAWQRELDQCGFNSTILKNLSKAYNCLTHDLLMAKLKAFGLDMASLSYEKSKEPKLDPVIVTASNWYVKFSKEFPNFSTSLNSDVFFELQKFNISNFPDNNTLY